MSNYPSKRAMMAAVSMELHAALSTKTIAKGHDLDERFPAYDELLSAAKLVLARLQHPTDRVTIIEQSALEDAVAKAEAYT